MSDTHTDGMPIMALPGLATGQWALPSVELLARLGLRRGWLRTLVMDLDALPEQLRRLEYPPGVQVCILIEGQTGGANGLNHDWARVNPVARWIAANLRGLVHAVEVFNELDIWHWSPPPPFESSAILTPAFAASRVQQALGPLKDAGMLVIAPSVAGPWWTDYLTQMAAILGDGPDMYAFHPYGQRAYGVPTANTHWPELTMTLAQARALVPRPLAITEIGVKIGEAGGAAGQAAYVRALARLMAQTPADQVAFWNYFALQDSIGTDAEQQDQAFGLMLDSGTWRPAAFAFAEAVGEQLEPDPLAQIRAQLWATENRLSRLRLALETELARRTVGGRLAAPRRSVIKRLLEAP